MDKSILEELRANCRITYRALADKHDISSNAIKRRIDRLIEAGVIEKFTIQLSLAMMNAERVLSFLFTDGSENTTELADKAGEHLLVQTVGFDSTGCWDVVAYYRHAKDLSELGDFLRSLEGVKRVEMHPLILETGRSVEFNKLEIRVIRVLLEDPRLSMSEIAKKTGLTSRRVRRILGNLMEKGGLHFTAIINWNAGDQTRVSFRVQWDSKTAERKKIVEKIKANYPDKLVGIYHSSINQLMWVEFMIDHVRYAQEISEWLTQDTSIKVMSTIIPYPRNRYPSLHEKRLQEILSKFDE